MHPRVKSRLYSLTACLTMALSGLAGIPGLTGQAQAATNGSLVGEIESITITTPGDKWSAGTITVAGQIVTIPRNLLIDLPANRLTLQEIYEVEAPTACKNIGKSGLAKTDPLTCNTYGTGANASISANRTGNGNLVAGDVFIQKGTESFAGAVTYISYTDGYFRIGGTPTLGPVDPGNGVMVRLNDPDGRQTLQSGPGCVVGTALAGQATNCSPDLRFNLDGDNYTNVFTTGYPMCIPSTKPRQFNEQALQLFNVNGATEATPVVVPFDLNGVGGLTTITVQANADGTGDLLCSVANRTANNGLPMNDSRIMAPIRVGDNVVADGNWEIIGGVRFLSAHSTMTSAALTTRNTPGQPDYLFLNEMEVDVAGFQNQRARTLMIGFVSLAAPTADVMIWSLHYDPTTGQAHELPLASVIGCEAAAGAGSCAAQGLGGVAGNNIFKMRTDVDFNTGADPKLNPCAHLLRDPRMPRVCNGDATGTNIGEMLGILSPIPHEVQARTGKKYNEVFQGGPFLITLDIQGKEATNGQYLFPFGMNLGGISTPEFDEIDLNAMQTPLFFSGIPWNLDRRLGPGGCDDTVPGTCGPRAALDPFPYEQLDPRTQTNLPLGLYNDLVYTSAPLSDVRNRIFTYVDASGRAAGDNTVLVLNPVLNLNTLDPAAFAIPPTPSPIVGGGVVGQPPTIVVDLGAAVSASVGTPFTFDVNATDPNAGDVVTFNLVAPFPAGMVINVNTGVISGFTPTLADAPSVAFSVRATDQTGLSDTQAFTLTVNAPPVITSTAILSGRVDLAYSYDVNATDVNGGTLTYSLVAPFPAGMTIDSGTGVISWTPTAAQAGANPVTVRVTDPTALFASQSFSVNVAVNAAPVINSAPVLTGSVGIAYSYDVDATDANGDTLTYSLLAGAFPTGMTINPASGLIAWTPTAGQVGPNPVTVQVSDGFVTVGQSFSVEVANVVAPAAPVITSTPILTANEQLLYTYDVDATDANGDTITYSIVTPPTGVSQVAMAINPTTGVITWTPGAAQSGNRTVTVRASDGTLGVNQTFTIVVANNVAPIFTSANTATVQGGTAINYTVQATDPSLPITYNLQPNAANPTPAGMTINGTTGVITWTAPVVAVNTAETFRVRATDATGLGRNLVVNVTITP